jgi:peptidoglycan-associated lipoprotein
MTHRVQSYAKLSKTKEEVEMMVWRNIALCGAVSFAVFALAGCSSTATKPESTATAAAQPPAESKESKKQSKAAVSDSKATSSLDALQRGESPGAGPLKEIYFDFDRYDLRADARETLKANWEWLKANPAAQVQIEGHADERGTTEYNLGLGSKRAQSVRDYLVTLGTGAERLSTISYGEEIPACREQTEECWQKNRRARFAIQPARPTS